MIIIQKGDQGIHMIAQVLDYQTKQVVNISSASNITFIFQTPEDVKYSVAGTLYTDGYDGKASYISGDADFMIAGIWRFQLQYMFGPFQKYTSWTQFQVVENLADF